VTLTDGGQRAGDIEAAYRAYRDRCFDVALRIVRDRHLAEDVVQEVFETLCRHPDSYDPERGTLSAWLMTVTHHRAVSLVRWRHGRTRLDAGEDGTTGLVDSAPTVEEFVVLIEDGDRVRAALLDLPAIQREVLLLAYFYDCTQRDIARRIGIPLGTVKSRTLHGLRRLQQQLEAPSPSY
jgi:RNA polymerase sigma factor (sigma-70 family)